MSLARQMKFNRWLTQFRYEHSKRGKLARYVLIDAKFPLSSVSFMDGLEYLESNKVHKYLITEYLKQWDIFRQIPLVKTKEVLKNIISPKSLFNRRSADLKNFDKKPQLIEI